MPFSKNDDAGDIMIDIFVSIVLVGAFAPAFVYLGMAAKTKYYGWLYDREQEKQRIDVAEIIKNQDNKGGTRRNKNKSKGTKRNK